LQAPTGWNKISPHWNKTRGKDLIIAPLPDNYIVRHLTSPPNRKAAMEILRTKVFPKVDRNVATRVIQDDMKQGVPVLFSLVDKKGGAISGCQRLSKLLALENSVDQKAKLSNYSKGYHPLSEVDAETIIKGLGGRFPCDHGWIMSVRQPQEFVNFFGRNSLPVNQNCFLPGACNVFCFSVFGALALSVRALSFDHAITEIENDVAELPFETKSWAFMHFCLDESDRKMTTNMKRSRRTELENHLKALETSVQAGQRDGREETLGAPRVSLSSVARKHFRKLGYVWNKSESEPRVTVFDKVTDRGNVIRIAADAGGFNEVIPYVHARFLSAAFISPAVSVVSVQGVHTAEELEALLARHTKDLRYYEEHVAEIYDEEMGRCHPTITKLIQDHGIRQIE
jgi:hypothetical protein